MACTSRGQRLSRRHHVSLPVAVESGRARVELSAEASDGTSDQQREQMITQLAWTLDQVDGVQQVVVRADGVPLTDTAATAGPAESFSEFDPNPGPGRGAVRGHERRGRRR